MSILRTFGLFAALGIMFCFLFSYLLGVIILPYQAVTSGISISIGPQLSELVQHVLKYKKKYSILCIIILLISFVGIYMLKNDTYTLGYFPGYDKVVKDHRKMESLWGAYLPIDFLVEPAGNTKLSDRSIVQSTISFSDSVLTLSKVESVFGFHTLYLAGLQQYHPLHYERLVKSQGSLNLASKNAAK